jgi:spermidine synthase
VATDGRRFLQRTALRFDVIILDLPDPTTLALNRFFTTEFFAAARRALAPGGVLAFGLGRYQNYLSPDLARLLASAHGTLKSTFAHVRLIPGGRVFFLGSDAPLHLDIAARLEARGVQTSWVNRHFLDGALAPDRLADLERALAQPAARNTDFGPVLYYYHLRHWLGQFTTPYSLPGLLVLGALAVYLFRQRAVPRVVFAAGFAASALELIALLAYQVFYGSLYQQVGLVITVFMAGLAVGAAWTVRLGPPAHPVKTLAALGLGIAALAGALPWVLAPLGRLDAALGTELAGQAAILLLTFALATLVGAQFPLAGAAGPPEAGRGAARLFTADLLGAALGALLVSAWLLPLLGVTAVCLLTAGLNAGAAALAWRTGANP